MEGTVLACEAPTGGAGAATAAAPGAGGEGDDGGAGDVVMLRRSALAACLTCPLCGRLLRDAATITECLHTFCRKCISEEFINKEVCCCPICSIDLGCAPLEKLRIDHSLQYLRSKVFPFKKQKVEGPEVTSPITSPIKTKERSLSSLTKHAPQMSMRKCLTKRRTKASGLRKLPLHSTLRGSSNITKKSGGWRSLGCHFRAAKNKKSLRPKSEDVKTAEKKTDDPGDVTHPVAPESPAEPSPSSGRVPVPWWGCRRPRPPWCPLRRRQEAGVRPTAPSAVGDPQGAPSSHKKSAPRARKGQPPLPQIPSKFFRIKDVNLPASFIQKYLVQKLNLSSEPEVEILCGGKPVNPGIPMHDIADYWIDKRPKGQVRSSVGTPAAEFVLKVFYARSGAPLPETENNMSPRHIPPTKRLCSSCEDQLAGSEVPHIVEPAPAQAVEEVRKRPWSLCEDHLDLSPSHIPSRRRLCSSHEDQFARPKVLEPEVSSTIPEEPPATDLLLSAGMQIVVPLQDLQGQSADVVPAPPAPCFELMQSKQKSVSIAATSPTTRPSDNVSASEDKMPEDLPTLVEQVAVAESEGELLNKILDLQNQFQFRLFKKNSALVTRAESAEAKLAEQEECSAKLRTCHLVALAVLKEHILSLEKENTKILSSLKEHAQTENRLKEQLTNQVDRCKYAKNQLCQAQQREADLKCELDSKQNVRKEIFSQLFTGMQEIQTLNTSENQASAHFLDQLREVPRLIREYCKKQQESVLQEYSEQ